MRRMPLALCLVVGRLALCMPFLALLTCDLPARAQVWVERSTTKVLKGKPPLGKSTAAFIEAARNEYEGFQVVIRAQGGKPLPLVDVTLGTLAGPDGAEIPASLARLYFEYYVKVEQPSPCDPFFNDDCTKYPPYVRLPGEYPDALVPFLDPYVDGVVPVGAPFDLAAEDQATVFVDLYVPGDAAPGTYQGELTVRSAGEELALVPVKLDVWDFEIPDERHVATSFGFSGGQVAKYHSLPDSETAEEVHRNYELEIHRHRIDYTTYNPGLSFQFDDAGQLLPVDFSAYDAWLGPRIDGSYFPDGAGLNRFNLGMFSPGHGTGGLTEAQFVEAARAVVEHLDSKGWLPRVYLYSLDEPWLLDNWKSGSYDKIKAGVGLLSQASELWDGHVLVTGPWQQVLDGIVDIWCPVTPMYGDTFWPKGSWPGPDKYADLLAQGQELWFYVCNANFPPQMGYDIDTRIGHEPRLLKWGAWAEHATGFLFWSMTYWFTNDPWHDLANYAQFGDLFSRNGDGILVYPGNHDGTAAPSGSPVGIHLDGPVVSLRMKQIRDGLEDWELFLLASSLGAEEWTRKQVATAYSAFGQPFGPEFSMESPPWTLDEEVLFEARRQVALKVQHLLHPERYEDPEVPAAAEQDGLPESFERVEQPPDVIEPGELEVCCGAELVIDTGGDALPPPLPDSSAGSKADIMIPSLPQGSNGCSAGAAPSNGFPSLLLLVMVFALLLRQAGLGAITPRVTDPAPHLRHRP